ncbi:MAG: alpha-mannosidase [Ruminococcaceae bacterium]|nr:alpha-mannosidase [Oscillospiraceae bacterium]
MYYTLEHIERICRDLQQLIHQPASDITGIVWQQGLFTNPAEADAAAGWQPFAPGDRWGTYDGHAWFRAEVDVPEDLSGKKLVLDVSVDQENWFADSRQFLLFINGQIHQGMDVNHRTSVVSKSARGGEKIRVDLQAYAGLVKKSTELYMRLLVEHEPIKKIYYDLAVPCQIARELPEGNKTRLDLLHVLNQAVNLLDLRKALSTDFILSVQAADTFLDEQLYRTLCHDSKVKAVAVGHTHIDVAWLWRLRQTREKTGRSFATVLRLMEDYPEYVFMSSQPQLYAFLEEDYPELFDRVKQRIKQGRWEAEGAMWLEADCNLTSGESLVRQLMSGIKYFQDRFAVDSRILWLPDVFGYSAALPQLLRQAGIDYFMTTKINWNQYNNIPADSFYWEGLDGSQVLTHFITTPAENNNPTPFYSTYNGVLQPRSLMGGWKRYQDKQIHDEILVSYGYGDGGGGPNEAMLENGRRLARGIPGCPQVVMGRSLSFFQRLEETVKNSPWVKKWVGELYFENHRGTYTSMGRNKRYNRKSELLSHDVETLSVLAGQMCGLAWPGEALERNWKTILLNQFHDILPGSSIEPVYEDSREQYEQVLRENAQLADQAIDCLTADVQTAQPVVVVLNTAGYERSELVSLPWPETSSLPQLTCQTGGPALAVQRCGQNLVFLSQPVPAKGYCSLLLHESDKPVETTASMAELSMLHISTDHLENRFFSIDLDDAGHMIHIYDKTAQREVIQAGRKANLIRAFEDKPMRHQNWDIDIYYQQKSWEIADISSIEILEQGPVRAALQITRPFLDSRILQTIYIYDQIPRIDFATTIEWREDELLLKAEFPVDIHADTATYDIQFGNVTRPTHWNTSWDWARFEVCAHKWADLSEEGYGVSLLNDCKYGHDIRDGVMRLTLLKSGMAPNPRADREIHRFTYSLFPHTGSWRQAGTMQQAYNLNLPLYARFIGAQPDGRLPASGSLCRVDAFDHVMLETVKQAEDGDGIILRLFEYSNWRGPVMLTFGQPVQWAVSCDLLERTQQNLTIESDLRTLSFYMKPYEVKTIRVKLAAADQETV